MTENKIIYFGTYPQAEVVPDSAAMVTIAEGIRNGNDYVIDKNIYDELIGLPDSAWDVQGDIVASDGSKYRRARLEDAAYASDEDWDEGYYQWNNTYHYFKHQPIKWRVLSAEGGTTFLLADVALDCRRYHGRYKSVTWKTSDIRNFLNTQFLKTAISADEREKIMLSNCSNTDNPRFNTPGGNDTKDSIFLLSIDEASNRIYGFSDDFSANDAARCCMSSAFAKAMGVYSCCDDDSKYNGNCWWWLRSPGYDATNAAYVDDGGWGSHYGDNVGIYYGGVRPAMRVNL